MIKITDKAKTEAVRLMEADGNPKQFIRVGVTGGGCSGLMYNLKFDSELNSNDQEYEDNGLNTQDFFWNG